MTRFDRIETRLTRLAAALAVAGGLGLIAATLITCTSILLKLGGRIAGLFYDELPASLAWMRSILGEEEMVSFGVGLALFAALPWVMIQRGHIRIDLFEPLFGGWLNRFLDVLADLSLAAIAYLIMTRQWFMIFKKARRSQEPMGEALLSGDFAIIGARLKDNLESQILGVPLWPTFVIAEICTVVFFVIACFCLLRSLRTLIRPVPAKA